MDSLERLLNRWSLDNEFVERAENWLTGTPVDALRVDIYPAGMHPLLEQALRLMGISSLYTHQYQSFTAASENQNVMIITGTASGKSLCYTLPVLDRLLKSPLSTTLLLFPTKALSQDQTRNINLLIEKLNSLGANLPEAAIYDGDTPMHRRSQIRKNARILITNPDMLHMGILPHHTNWDEFFKHLEFVIIDEAHTYRGVFGSHVCNLIRRLKRITSFYAGKAHFILTSATISNPESFALKLIEEPVELIDEDGSPRGARHFIIYNPPFIEARLGIRRSAYADTLQIAAALMDYNLQSIIFARSRQAVEKLVYDLRGVLNLPPEQIRGYRSGYLAQERREIEQGLKSGSIQLVVATNALELGVDIGEMKAAILVGYPGSIAALRQQAGRAGRKANASLAVLVATAGAIDQYLARHPEYLNKPPEHALLDPDNLIILLHHLRCAAFELPFSSQASFGSLSANMLTELLDILASSGVLSKGEQKYFWTSSQYPADTVSLRSASPEIITLHTVQDDRMIPIGEIDPHSAYWMTHPQAIYLHDGSMYRVDELDLKEKMALLTPVQVDYFTEARSSTHIEKISVLETQETSGTAINYGELLVSSQVTGYKKVNIYTREVMGEYNLDMPLVQFRTTGCWISLKETLIDNLRLAGKWNSDRNDYGPRWDKITLSIRRRDLFRCQSCGLPENGKAFHVHHKTPLRCFHNIEEANRSENLITLCPACHRKAESFVKVRSGLNGLRYAIQSLSPLFLMCDTGDIGTLAEPESALNEGLPAIAIYDMTAGGIGLSHQFYKINATILENIMEMIKGCDCLDGCPACVGPGGESGSGGKQEALAILEALGYT